MADDHPDAYLDSVERGRSNRERRLDPNLLPADDPEGEIVRKRRTTHVEVPAPFVRPVALWDRQVQGERHWSFSVGDFHPPASPGVVLCSDCLVNPAEPQTEAGLRCRFDEHKRRRRMKATNTLCSHCQQRPVAHKTFREWTNLCSRCRMHAYRHDELPTKHAAVTSTSVQSAIYEEAADANAR
jgi:hypothetical protein